MVACLGMDLTERLKPQSHGFVFADWRFAGFASSSWPGLAFGELDGLGSQVKDDDDVLCVWVGDKRFLNYELNTVGTTKTKTRKLDHGTIVVVSVETPQRKKKGVSFSDSSSNVIDQCIRRPIRYVTHFFGF